MRIVSCSMVDAIVSKGIRVWANVRRHASKAAVLFIRPVSEDTKRINASKSCHVSMLFQVTNSCADLT